MVRVVLHALCAVEFRRDYGQWFPARGKAANAEELDLQMMGWMANARCASGVGSSCIAD